jgi:hypothetical protein
MIMTASAENADELRALINAQERLTGQMIS